MDDFHDRTLELLSFPDPDGSQSLVGFPNTVEAFGCTAVHEPTLEAVGLDHPTTFVELESAARRIAESGDVDRAGIASRTSSEVLSSADWATMFATYGADWIDRDERTATLSSEQGVASLERFAGMLNGPDNPATYDWYAVNDAYSNGDVGMMYSTPQTSGIVDASVRRETTWLPSMPGPNGRSPEVATSVWAIGITGASDHPEAAWLYIQWVNSRPANLLLSTRQWEGDAPLSGFARLDWVADQVQRGNAPQILGGGYVDVTRQALANAPGGNPAAPGEYPAVPLDTPQTMNIMYEAAGAMSSAVSGNRTARAALDGVARTTTDNGYLSAASIPDRYVAADRFG